MITIMRTSVTEMATTIEIRSIIMMSCMKELIHEIINPTMNDVFRDRPKAATGRTRGIASLVVASLLHLPLFVCLSLYSCLQFCL